MLPNLPFLLCFRKSSVVVDGSKCYAREALGSNPTRASFFFFSSFKRATTAGARGPKGPAREVLGSNPNHATFFCCSKLFFLLLRHIFRVKMPEWNPRLCMKNISKISTQLSLFFAPTFTFFFSNFRFFFCEYRPPGSVVLGLIPYQLSWYHRG